MRARALRRAALQLPGGLEEAKERLVFASRGTRPQHLERLRGKAASSLPTPLEEHIP